MSLCKPCKSEFSVPFSFLAFLDVIPIDFQNLAFGGIVFPGQDLRVGVPEVGTRIPHSSGEFCTFATPPNSDGPWWGFSLGSLCLCLSSYLDTVLLPLVVEALFVSVLRSLSEGIIPRVGVDFRVHGRRGVRNLVTPPS